MPKTIVAVFENKEGVRIKTLAIPYFQDTLYLAHCPRLTLRPMDDNELAFISPIKRRFEFWDREGIYYIYKEKWEGKYKDLYFAYQCNLAMAFKDECGRMGYKFPDLHIIANNAAKNFLDLWIRRTENARI
jgi:hypothetical protein